MSKAVNPRDVALIFRDYVTKIHAKVSREDPNMLKLSVVCAKVSPDPLPCRSKVVFVSLRPASCHSVSQRKKLTDPRSYNGRNTITLLS
jgi:hypothetical protein